MEHLCSPSPFSVPCSCLSLHFSPRGKRSARKALSFKAQSSQQGLRRLRIAMTLPRTKTKKMRRLKSKEWRQHVTKTAADAAEGGIDRYVLRTTAQVLSPADPEEDF
mmetsp:Transcript_68942/g.121889  ORF Transcript_68942/g.121889 Transcript_68942/m.121889 type:complete len:107 (-) Transcript_68942:417-737(-)